MDKQHDPQVVGPSSPRTRSSPRNGRCSPAIRCQGLTKTFGKGETAVPALRGIDLEVMPGAMTLLAGPSGCGKTTLISIIAGLFDPTAGSLDVLGHDLTKMPGGRAGRFSGQEPGLCLSTVQLAAVADRGRKRLSAAARGRRAAADRVGAGPRGAGPGGFEAAGRRLSITTFRRPAAAGGHRPGPGPRAAAAGLRRADGRPRRASRANGDGAVRARWPSSRTGR